MRINRLFLPSRVALFSFIVAVMFFVPAHAGPVADSLRVERTPVGIRLTWLAGTGPYGIYRAGVAFNITDPNNSVEVHNELSYEEPLGPPDLVFYVVDDPPDCGFVPCTGPLETLADLNLPPGAIGRRAVDESSIAYAALGPAGLAVIDVADPNAPATLGNWATPGLDNCDDIVQIGNFVYVACGASGVKCVDVSDPGNPTLHITLPSAGAVTVNSHGDALYVGVGSAVEIWNVSNPAAPALSGTLDGSAISNLARVQVDGNRLYCLYTDGELAIYDANNPLAPVPLDSFPTMPSAVDLVVRDGIAYCAYDASGILILDVRDLAAPVTLFSDGGSQTIGLDVRGRAMVSAYADGRFLTFGLRDPTSPQLLSASFAANPATGVSLLGNNVALYAYGPILSLVDPPPFVIAQSPVGEGSCPSNAEVLLHFSSVLDSASVDSGSVSVRRAEVTVNGALTTTGSQVLFTPAAGFLGSGDFDVLVSDSVRNHRGTPAVRFHGTFTIEPSCAEWISLPGSVVGGMPALFGFQIFGANIIGPEVLVSAYPDPSDPFADFDAVPGNGGPQLFSAQWTAPSVQAPTTYYAVVRANIDGQIATGPVASVLVTPDDAGQDQR
jgi:hypothetical protein